MNVVETIARMIDAEGAYAVATDSTLPDAKPMPFTTRQKYFQSVYEVKAVEIVCSLRRYSPKEMTAFLIDFEKKGWRRMGVPIDNPKFRDMVDRIIEEKYR